MEWWVILVLVLVIPLVLLPVALVWYLNISGIYQVIRATRARQKKRDEALKEAARAVQSS
jgi:hypothetical protein